MAQNIGQALARTARRVPLSVMEIAAYTGATRATIYNWLSGAGVSPAYRAKVQKLIDKYAKESK